MLNENTGKRKKMSHDTDLMKWKILSADVNTLKSVVSELHVPMMMKLGQLESEVDTVRANNVTTILIVLIIVFVAVGYGYYMFLVSSTSSSSPAFPELAETHRMLRPRRRRCRYCYRPWTKKKHPIKVSLSAPEGALSDSN